MRQVEAWQFVDSKIITVNQLKNGVYDARALTKAHLRTEVFEALKAHYGDDLPRAMTHIILWSEKERGWNYFEDGGSPSHTPDVKMTLAVVVEAFDAR